MGAVTTILGLTRLVCYLGCKLPVVVGVIAIVVVVVVVVIEVIVTIAVVETVLTFHRNEAIPSQIFTMYNVG